MPSAKETSASDPEWRRILVQAAALYEVAKQARVAAIFHAVNAALLRLRETESKECLRPLRMLLQDLDRLNSGKPAQILTPRKGSLPEPDRADGASIARQAYALAVQQTLFRAYGKHGRADIEAAKILSSLGYKTRAGHLVTANNLRQWRPLLRSDDRQHEQLQTLYRDLDQKIPTDLTEDEARECAAQLAKLITNEPGFDLS